LVNSTEVIRWLRLPGRIGEEQDFIVQRHGGIEQEVQTAAVERQAEADGRHTWRGQRRPASCRRVAHVHLQHVLVEEEAVAVIQDASDSRWPARQETELAIDGWAPLRRRNSGEEAVPPFTIYIVEEDAAHWAHEQQPVGVHGGAPILVNATADGEVPRPEATEDVLKQLVGEIVHGFFVSFGLVLL
jgi:hypothetical protein